MNKYIVTNLLGMKVYSPTQPWQKEEEPRKKTRRPPERLTTRTIEYNEIFEAVPYSNEGGIETVRLADFGERPQIAHIVRGNEIFAKLLKSVEVKTTEERLAELERRVTLLESRVE